MFMTPTALSARVAFHTLDGIKCMTVMSVNHLISTSCHKQTAVASTLHRYAYFIYNPVAWLSVGHLHCPLLL